MAQILGLGGIFVKCENVQAYRAWWSEHMGVNIEPWGSMEWPSDGKARTKLSSFEHTTKYLEPSLLPFMINLRVDDVAALIEKARQGGAEIVGDVEHHEYGIFGWFIDPAGIKIELWQEPETGEKI